MQNINLRNVLWLLLIRDWPWKLLSFAIALTIYFSVRAEISNVRTIPVPIIGDVGHIVTSVKPQTVHVTLRGSATELSQLYTPAVYFAVKPLAKTAKGKEKNDTETIRLKPSALHQIGRLRVARIEPSLVRVQFEQPSISDAPSAQLAPSASTNQLEAVPPQPASSEQKNP